MWGEHTGERPRGVGSVVPAGDDLRVMCETSAGRDIITIKQISSRSLRGTLGGSREFWERGPRFRFPQRHTRTEQLYRNLRLCHFTSAWFHVAGGSSSAEDCTEHFGMGSSCFRLCGIVFLRILSQCEVTFVPRQVSSAGR